MKAGKDEDDLPDEFGKKQGLHIAQSVYWKHFKQVCTDGQGPSKTLTNSYSLQCSGSAVIHDPMIPKTSISRQVLKYQRAWRPVFSRNG